MKDAPRSDFVKGNDGKNFCKIEYEDDGTILLNAKNVDNSKIDLDSLLLQIVKDWSVSHKREFRKLRRQTKQRTLVLKEKKIFEKLLACI